MHAAHVHCRAFLYVHLSTGPVRSATASQSRDNLMFFTLKTPCIFKGVMSRYRKLFFSYVEHFVQMEENYQKHLNKPKINEDGHKFREINFKMGLPTENRNENISGLIIIAFLFVCFAVCFSFEFPTRDFTEVSEFSGFD